MMEDLPGLIVVAIVAITVGAIGFIVGNGMGIAVPPGARVIQTSLGRAVLVEDATHHQRIVVDFNHEHIVVDVPATVPVN